MTTTPTPEAHIAAADGLLKAGVGSANIMLVAVLYLVTQLYSLTNEVAALQAVQAERSAVVAHHEARLQAQEARLANLERTRTAP